MSNVQYKSIVAMIFNEIKCHVNNSLGLWEDASPPVSAPGNALFLRWQRFLGYIINT